MIGSRLALCGLLLSASSVAADDLVLSPSPPVVQRVTYYSAPAVMAAPVPTTTYYAPAPTTSYYAPAPTTTYYAPAPAAVVAPVPVTSYYAPAVVAPRPVVTYYAPAATAVPMTTYYAPAATPVTTYYAPAAVPVAVPTYGYVRSKVYYPYEPVRNFFKAITP